MKKMASIVMMIMMVVMTIISASAESSNDVIIDTVYEWVRNNGLYETYNNIITEEESCYQCICFLDVETAEADFGGKIEGADWSNLTPWFDGWYKDELEKRYPEYGEINTKTTEIAYYNGVRIYRLEIIAENDLVNWYEGDQTKVVMICTVD